MKIQKIFVDLKESSRLKSIKDVILADNQKLLNIQNKIKKNESILADEVKMVLQNDNSLKELKFLFDIVVFDKNKNNATFLNFICKHLSESLTKFYNRSDDIGGREINHGQKDLILRELDFRNSNLEAEDLSKTLLRFNELMKPYEVWIRKPNIQYDKVGVFPIVINLRIIR